MNDDDDRKPLFYGESLAMLIIVALVVIAFLGFVIWHTW